MPGAHFLSSYGKATSVSAPVIRSAMKLIKHILLIASLALVPAFSTALGQGTTTGNAQIPFTTEVSAQDRAFVEQASAGLVFEINGGTLTLTNTSTKAVRRFGQRMIRDHSKDYQQLSVLGRRFGIALSGTPNPQQTATLIRLASKFNADFDQDYIKTEIEDHTADIHLYLDEVRNGTNTAIRTYAFRKLSVLFTHLQLAILTAQRIGISTSND